MIINCLFYGQNSTSFVSRLRYIDNGDSMKNLIAAVFAVNGTVEYDGTYYYVYASILSDSQNIEHMINYLNENNIYYYVKNITASEAFKNELYKYEELMKSTVSDVAFLELNEKILDLYEEA